MQNSQLPAKWLKPFAADDTNKVELPLTSADPTRASQSAGFPPLTMQPPESGGVPPQGEDFNGGMNQVARIVWWKGLAGGAIPYDATWAANAAINGYPSGAKIASADLQGDWISTADNNTANPDTVGTGWVPGYAYGITTVPMVATNVTLTPAQAAKPIIVVTGALTANVQLIFPAWTRTWTIVNNTTGSFTLTAKTAAGSGVVVPTQVPRPIWGDGTNLLAAGYATNQLAGVVGSVRNLRAGLTAANASATITADEVIVENALGGVRYCLPSFSKVINISTTGAGGMDTGAPPVSGWVAIYAIYNPASGVSALLGVNATAAVAPQVYGGANLPAGYTASGLISVLPTTAASLLAIFQQVDRDVYFFVNLIAAATSPVGFTSLSIASAVPRNAVRWRANGALTSSASSSVSFAVCPTITGIGSPGYVTVQTVTLGAGGTVGGTIPDSPIVTAQTTFYAWSNGAGSPTFTLNSYGYSF